MDMLRTYYDRGHMDDIGHSVHMGDAWVFWNCANLLGSDAADTVEVDILELAGLISDMTID